jgi:hypothetical protein
MADRNGLHGVCSKAGGMSDPLTEALAVLDAFMAALNRGDEAGVNASYNFPHVRLASGKVAVWNKRGDYRLDDFRARAGEGWAESRWDERAPIHVGPAKVISRCSSAVGARMGR